MNALWHSLTLVTIAEIGDKTQLLSILLASRFKKFWPIVLGIFVATIANHALAALLGNQLASLASGLWVKNIAAIFFIGIGIWALVPDDAPEETEPKYGAFVTSVIAFFIAEMGDKTQLATITLGAEYSQTYLVILGTTIGMLIANVPAVIFGENILKIMPLKFIRIVASVIFIGFGVYSLCKIYFL